MRCISGYQTIQLKERDIIMNKDDKCYYCDEMGVDMRRVCVDSEPDYDGEEWSMAGIYREVLLCPEHLQEWNEMKGIFAIDEDEEENDGQD